jgi:hypothetical protein
MNENKRWTTSGWKKEDLQSKTVEFSLPVPNDLNRVIHGIGKFQVVRNPEGLLLIHVVVTEQPGSSQFRSTHRELPQWAVDRIQKHPNQEIAEFLLA